MNLTCSECGNVETGSFFDTVEKTLTDHQLCFGCNHWREMVEIGAGSRGHQVVRVKHVHYMMGEEAGPKRWRGFGGDYFRIRFHDGREVESTNMWCQGHIPAHYHDRLPDNAEFVTAFAYRPEHLPQVRETEADQC
jgi:hypothetical protein